MLANHFTENKNGRKAGRPRFNRHMGSDHFSRADGKADAQNINSGDQPYRYLQIRSRVFFDTFMGNLLVVNDVHIECKYIPAADGAMSANSAAGFNTESAAGFGKKLQLSAPGAQQGHQMMENKFHKLFLRIIRVPDIRGNRRISVKGVLEKVSAGTWKHCSLQPASSFLSSGSMVSSWASQSRSKSLRWAFIISYKREATKSVNPAVLVPYR